MTPQNYVKMLMIRGNASDFIGHHLPKDSTPAHGASHHAWAPSSPPSKSGAAYILNAVIRNLYDFHAW